MQTSRGGQLLKKDWNQFGLKTLNLELLNPFDELRAGLEPRRKAVGTFGAVFDLATLNLELLNFEPRRKGERLVTRSPCGSRRNSQDLPRQVIPGFL